ncbi:MAG TPA: RNA polymerase subunit sigma [Candidatus Scatomorpha merdigallinarum]|nr:RNA polymerase subunit sigma [Candidatus Scatomorpha merdigallinarum]
MVSTKQDIVEWVLAAKEDPEAADRLINQYMGFIRAEAKKLSFGDGEDELSIAMFAFYEAVVGYERSRGNFLKFASKVIRSRLIDYHRAESRHRGHGSLNERASQDGAELLELLPDTRDDIEELNTREAAQSEIEEYARALAAFGITFSEVADNCPKQERTLAACMDALNYARRRPELLAAVEKSGKLPMTELASGAGVERKTLERHRKYLVAMLIAFTNGFEIIRGHLCRLDGGRGTK